MEGLAPARILELEWIMGQAQEMAMGLLPVSVVKRVPVKTV